MPGTHVDSSQTIPTIAAHTASLVVLAVQESIVQSQGIRAVLLATGHPIIGGTAVVGVAVLH